MGGKNAALVFNDCNLEKTVDTLIRSSFINQGQVCLCTSRIYVQSQIYDEFLTKFVAAARWAHILNYNIMPFSLHLRPLYFFLKIYALKSNTGTISLMQVYLVICTRYVLLHFLQLPLVIEAVPTMPAILKKNKNNTRPTMGEVSRLGFSY